MQQTCGRVLNALGDIGHDQDSEAPLARLLSYLESSRIENWIIVMDGVTDYDLSLPYLEPTSTFMCAKSWTDRVNMVIIANSRPISTVLHEDCCEIVLSVLLADELVLLQRQPPTIQTHEEKDTSQSRMRIVVAVDFGKSLF